MKKLLKIIVKIMFVILWLICNMIIWCYNTALGRIVFGLIFFSLILLMNDKTPWGLIAVFGCETLGFILFISASCAPNQQDPEVDYGEDQLYPLDYSCSPKDLRERVAKIYCDYCRQVKAKLECLRQNSSKNKIK